VLGLNALKTQQAGPVAPCERVAGRAIHPDRFDENDPSLERLEFDSLSARISQSKIRIALSDPRRPDVVWLGFGRLKRDGLLGSLRRGVAR
jgi:hypothetical protein